MAGVATCRAVHVTRNIRVMGIRVGLAVRVAINAGEHGIVRGIVMTVRARRPHARVGSRIDWEPGVIECRARPRACVVAKRASRREICSDVARIRGALVVGLVARVAGRRRAGVLVVNVATGASNGLVRTRQRESRLAVIKAGGNPGRSVAHLTSLRKSCSDMVRIRCTLKIFEVARNASRTQIGEFAAHVARLALHCGMRTGERETSKCTMVKMHAHPRCGVMAG